MALREAVAANADEFAETMAPVLDDLRTEGITTLRKIAEVLNERGVLTRRGRRWHVSNVRNLLVRLAGDEPYRLEILPGDNRETNRLVRDD